MKNRNNILISDAVDLLQLRVDESISFFVLLSYIPGLLKGEIFLLYFFLSCLKWRFIGL